MRGMRKQRTERRGRLRERLEGLSEELQLDNTQRSQLAPIMQKTIQQVRILIRDTANPVETRRTQLSELLEASHHQIEPFLNATQQQKLEGLWQRLCERILGRL